MFCMVIKKDKIKSTMDDLITLTGNGDGMKTFEEMNNEEKQEHILNILCKEYKRVNRRLDAIEVSNLDEIPSVDKVKKIFEGSNLRQIWLIVEERMDIINFDRYSDKQTLIKYINKRKNELNRNPKYDDLDRKSLKAIANYFGDLDNLLNELNFSQSMEYNMRPKCDCGCYLIYIDERSEKVKQHINLNGYLIYTKQYEKIKIGHYLYCERCYNKYAVSKDKDKRIIRSRIM